MLAMADAKPPRQNGHTKAPPRATKRCRRTSVWSISCSCASSLALSSRLQTLWNSLRAAFVSSQPAPSRPAEPRATDRSAVDGCQGRHGTRRVQAEPARWLGLHQDSGNSRHGATRRRRAGRSNQTKQSKAPAKQKRRAARSNRARRGGPTRRSNREQHSIKTARPRKAPAAKQNRSQTIDLAAPRGTHIASGRRRSCPPHRPGTGRLPSPTACQPS